MEAQNMKTFFYMSSNFHNAYGHMVRNPPQGFEYEKSEFMAHKATGGKLKSIQPFISPIYNDLLIRLGRPKVRKFDASGFDLVHSAQSLLDTNKPYVVDFEHAAVFCGFNQYALDRPAFAKALSKVLLDKNLKKIMPFTNAAKASLCNSVQGVEEKVEVVTPPITPPEQFKKLEHSGVNFLFIGKAFYEKGGLDVLLAFDKISRRYDCSLAIVSPTVPEEVKAKFSKNPSINFFGSLTTEELKRFYLGSDVLVFPSHYDTYGFVIPEAFSYGLPVITTNSFALPELVEHEKTGLIVKSFYSSFREDFGYRYPTVSELSTRRLMDCKNPTEGYVGELAQAMERMIQEGTLGRMSENARAEALNGKFSLGKWKEKMGRIYEEAMQ
jgi:glycosyltransferase involved in cell wall biosynthesis